MKAVRAAHRSACLFVQQTDNAAEIKGTGINLRTLSLARTALGMRVPEP